MARGGKFATGLVSGAFGQISSRVTGLFQSPYAQTLASAVGGGLGAKLGGGKFRNGALTSAFSYLASNYPEILLDLALKVWALPNTALGLVWGGVGHIYGEIRYALDPSRPQPSISIDNNAIQFINNPFMGSAMTLGNVIIYGSSSGPGNSNRHFQNTPAGYKVGNEEMYHTQQSEILGLFYFPAHIIGGLSSLFRSPHPGLRYNVDPWHRNNFMETGPMQGRVF